MNIKDQWDRLDPATQKWLMENPGCLILPRTITAVICQATGTEEGDQHGETLLSEEDCDFIRLKAHEADAPPPDHLVLDATQP